MSRSAVKRPRSAWRIREKAAAAMPVRACAPCTVRRSRSRVFDNLGRKECLELIGVRVDPAKISECIAATTYDFYCLFSPHENISFNCVNRFLTTLISRGGLLLKPVHRPPVVSQLHRIDNTECTTMFRGLIMIYFQPLID